MSLNITSVQVEPGSVNTGAQFFLRVAITDSLEGWLRLKEKNAATLKDANGKYLFVEG